MSHPTIPVGLTEDEFAKVVAGALRHMFATTKIIATGDRVEIYANDGQWELTVSEPESRDDPAETETPLDTPSLDTSFHDHEMDV